MSEHTISITLCADEKVTIEIKRAFSNKNEVLNKCLVVMIKLYTIGLHFFHQYYHHLL
jgi:hypothetical protein